MVYVRPRLLFLFLLISLASDGASNEYIYGLDVRKVMTFDCDGILMGYGGFGELCAGMATVTSGVKFGVLHTQA